MTTADLLHELRNNHNDFPTYLHDLAARAADALESSEKLVAKLHHELVSGGHNARRDFVAESNLLLAAKDQRIAELTALLSGRQSDTTPGDDAINS